MDIIIAIIYIILFILMMIFVFSIGMLRPYMPKKEIVLVLLVAFLIGSIGGAFFLEPVYQEIPSVAGVLEKNIPGQEETMYLDLSSSTNIDELTQKLSSTEGFVSFKETSVTIPLWKFNEQEYSYFNEILGNIDDNYKHYNVTEDGKVEIEIEDNYTSHDAIKSFADWYRAVYGGSLSYAQVHAKLEVQSSADDAFRAILLEKGIVPTKVEGPIQDKLNDTSEAMLPSYQFVLITGIIGVIVALLGIYYETFGLSSRKFKKFIMKERKR
jgi:hypothetical protein